ncbi:hypothetical protein E2I00_005427 [Balaenoptera physalus]|uniref:Uncharacterized protein n=1 Tax=Balaenoptera physalus TaxID=9770 RepID=A0A643CH20_BALPH|nr:hypothetical protein E2I00_005427 [Balaenoptera physalus]
MGTLSEAAVILSESDCDICLALRETLSLFVAGTPEDYMANVRQYETDPLVLDTASQLKSCADRKLTDEAVHSPGKAHCTVKPVVPEKTEPPDQYNSSSLDTSETPDSTGLNNHHVSIIPDNGLEDAAFGKELRDRGPKFWVFGEV